MQLLKSSLNPQYLFKPKVAFSRAVKEIFHVRGEVMEVALPWKVQIRIDAAETIGRSIWHGGLFDLVVSETLWRLLEPGDQAIDAGANIGYMASLMATRVGTKGKILSFEAHPDIYKELSYNITLFQRNSSIGAIQAYHVALSDEPGIASLVCDGYFNTNRGTAHISSDTPSDTSATVIKVDKKPLDEFIAGQKFAVMKLDVENHEIFVLEGAEKALRDGNITNIVYEDFTGEESRVHKLLTKYGYTVYSLGQQTHKPVLFALDGRNPINPEQETPNFLAALEPDKIQEKFSKWWWRVL